MRNKKDKIDATDPHFNLFYSYSLGGKKKNNEGDETDENFKKDENRIKILENNLTRAFLITLKSFSRDQVIFYLNSLFKKKRLQIKKSKNIYYALQNIDEQFSEQIKDKKTKKILLVISDTKLDITKEDLIKSLEENTSKDSRPDGWLILDDWAIMIESKIKDNKVNTDQLKRHIEKHFRIDKYNINENFWLVTKSWRQIIDSMVENNFYDAIDNDNQLRKYFIKDFKEVLMKTGQKLDLSFITSEKGYNRIDARQQFKTLLISLDEKIKVAHPSLIRSGRPLADYIWDFYGLFDKGKIQYNPHYSIYFDIDGAGISLTTRNLSTKMSQMEKIIEHGEFNNIFNKVLFLDKIQRSRYFLQLVNYKLMDWKKGKQRGKTFETFKFELNFSELNPVQTDINEIKNQFKQLKKYAKQFEFGIRILYPYGKIKTGDEESMRGQNKNLFDNEDKLIELYIDFINDTSTIYKNLLNLKTEE